MNQLDLSINNSITLGVFPQDNKNIQGNGASLALPSMLVGSAHSYLRMDRIRQYHQYPTTISTILFFLLALSLVQLPTTTSAEPTISLPILPSSFSNEDRHQVQQRVEIALSCHRTYSNTQVKQHAFSGDLNTRTEDTCSSIPTIIHQTWKTKEMPEEYQLYQQSWRDNNPGWYLLVWSDADAEEFLETNFPGMLETFHSYPYSIERADAIRYFILLAYGGVYADMDYECFEPLDNYIHSMQSPVGLITPSNQRFSNSLMISTANHSFWNYVVEQLPEALEASNKQGLYKDNHVLQSTGPHFINKRAYSFEHSQDIGSLNKGLFSPCSFCSQSCVCDGCWTIHHYAKSWNSLSTRFRNFWRCDLYESMRVNVGVATYILAFLLIGAVCLCLQRRRTKKDFLRFVGVQDV